MGKIVVTLGILAVIFAFISPFLTPILNIFDNSLDIIMQDYLDGVSPFLNELSKSFERFSEFNFVVFILIFGIITGAVVKK